MWPRYAYEWHDDSGNWSRSYGNENWEFDADGLTEHCPEALSDECCVILLEPKSTLNTGNVINERTVPTLKRL